MLPEAVLLEVALAVELPALQVLPALPADSGLLLALLHLQGGLLAAARQLSHPVLVEAPPLVVRTAVSLEMPLRLPLLSQECPL